MALNLKIITNRYDLEEKGMKRLESILRNDLIYKIRNFDRPIKETTQNVWGKYVKLIDKNGEICEHELQSWCVTVPIYVGIDIKKFTIDAKVFLHNYELSCLVDIEPNMKKWDDYTLYHLSDWDYLEDEFGEIIRNNRVTFIKHAIILKDSEG